MAISKKMRELILARDGHCYHCGTDDDTLVVHHRKGRGLGGSKLLDTPDNLMTVCSRWNGDMESNAELAATARGWGHKLPVWESLEHPVFDRMGGWWYLLLDGTKVESHWKDQAF